MKAFSRTSLALAAFCTAGAALAQSNVSLYGLIDVSVEHQKHGSAKASGLASNGSFIGLRGQEDLGGGLKAGFVLESLINADSGSGADQYGSDDSLSFKRRSEVNFTGSFGTVRLGTFKRASYEATAQAISWHNDNAGSTADRFASANSHSNVLAYRTPDLGGLSAELQYRFGEKRVWVDDIQYRDGVDLGLRYDRGPWGLGLGYTQNKLKGDVYGDTIKDKTYSLRASYDNGVWALGAYYLRDESRDNWPGIERTHSHRNTLRIAGKYVSGASEFHASVGHSRGSYTIEATDGRLSATEHAKFSSTQWLLAYHYNLSRRTKVYAFYGHDNNGPAMQSFPALWNGQSGSFRTLGMGVRHLF